ncbi:MAG: transposase, partial [Candidatus Moranbacteria bacterium]|nr:transposase [Candidatus Moranbacteria bacterium]
MKKEMEKMFCLPEILKIDKLEDKGNGIVVLNCSTKKRKEGCPHCGGSVSGYDHVRIKKQHTVIGGKKIWLHIKKRRYQCQKCKKVFV